MNNIELLIEAKLADNNHRAAAIATGCKFWELKTDEEKLTRARLYRNWRDSGVFGNKTKPCFEMSINGEDVPVICGHDTAVVIEHVDGIIKMQCTWACQKVYYEKHVDGLSFECQPCGHPLTSIVNDDENTHYCRECAEAAQ